MQEIQRSLRLAPNVDVALVRVPGAEFTMGSHESDSDATPDELPQHRVYLDEYWIGRHPITVAQFSVFIDETGYQTSAEKLGNGWTWDGPEWKLVPGASWRKPRGPESDVAGKAEHPASLVSWEDATAFCAWAARLTGEGVRLPTEAEWEKAARGTDGRMFPWGSEPPSGERCNAGMRVGDTTAVGQFSPLGDSPYGCTDIVGNVWEWTSSLFLPYPYTREADSGDEASRPKWAVRGGSYRSVPRYLRCACRGQDVPDHRIATGGLRICVAP